MTHKIKRVFSVFDAAPTKCEIDYALLAIRLAVGLFFVSFGFGKLFGAPGLEGFTGMLEGLGFPAPALLALLVGVAEFFGGLAIILGVLTRFSAFWLALISVVAWATVKGFTFGFMQEGNIDLLALGLTLALVKAGPGAISVSAHFKKKKGGDAMGAPAMEGGNMDSNQM